ncbi:hypothetical protein GLOTRDRAFT_43899 [Gloeophyllum trabeum ATCC 11539]|uniref:Uncharacterized protein n=1 Tax=Gloeophyllum trabeum (strain ATCC 11539 / FP-39264 / Madison 617) TaxID=670483 RepID=S7Q4C7_GLOTA|nr:uncharacterized protein GLOTRDRAFT_43899 [Gloeophyllum trabeum ATCC 11539]EPQ54362.1 hypothetical protein GLOTRDRAFT_43899 [Gloeophyllum trabeum ATCC 11539]
MRVQGFHPFALVMPSMPLAEAIGWQDWVTADALFDTATGTIKRDPDVGRTTLPHLQGEPLGQPSSGLAPLDSGTIADILIATRTMPAWKACQIEGTNWEGTAQENIQKYVSSIGTEERPS